MTRRSIPELDELASYPAWLEVVKTYAKCQRLLARELEDLGLSIAKHEVLLVVLRDEGVSQRALAERLLVTKSNVTALVQKLEAAGWLRREVDPVDARGRRLYVTPAGKALARRAAKRQAKVVRIMTGDLSQREVDALHRVMRAVGGKLDAALEAD